MVVDLQTPQFPEALTLPQQARAIVIKDQATYNEAATLKISFSQWRKKIVDEFAPMKEAAHKAHKAITAKEGEYLAPVTEAEGILKTAIIRYQDEQEAIRRTEQRRLEEVARQAAEADRQRREAEAAEIRQAELKARLEAIKAEEDARVQAALNAQANGAGNDIVESILDTPTVVIPEVAPLSAYIEPAPYITPVVAAPTYDRVVGTGIVRTWSAQVTSIRELCAAVVRGDVAENYVLPNQVALNQRAKADKSAMKIPGVVAVQK